MRSEAIELLQTLNSGDAATTPRAVVEALLNIGRHDAPRDP